MSKLHFSIGPTPSLASGSWGYIVGYVEANTPGLVPDRIALYRFDLSPRFRYVNENIIFNSFNKIYHLEAGPRLIQTSHDARVVSSCIGDECDIWLRGRRYGLENRYDYHDLANFLAFQKWLASIA